MFIQSTKKRMKCIVSAVITLILVCVFVAPMASAALASNTIDPVAIVTDNGRHIIATGPIGCTEGQMAYLQVTVTQHSTGAVSEGRTRVTCTGDTQQWEVHASIRGKETFEEGPATAVALARTSDHEDTDDAHQWLVNITLVGDLSLNSQIQRESRSYTALSNILKFRHDTVKNSISNVR